MSEELAGAVEEAVGDVVSGGLRRAGKVGGAVLGLIIVSALTWLAVDARGDVQGLVAGQAAIGERLSTIERRSEQASVNSRLARLETTVAFHDRVLNAIAPPSLAANVLRAADSAEVPSPDLAPDDDDSSD